jgi:excinuclease ABC subunit C
MSDPKYEARITAIRDKIKALPKSAGVYLFKDSLGRVLYVGKAVDLRSRVASYFQDAADLAQTRGPHIVQMAEQVADIDWIECDTEVDALLQENRLIKDIQPAYNERLRDDKTFPYLEITIKDEFPGVYVTRSPRPDSKLYGPFVNAAGLRAAVNALQKAFRFRTCGLEVREDDPDRPFFRPCILYNIGRCTAPCGARISREEYRKNIQRLMKFLGSSRRVVLKQMTREMEQASKDLRFEEAARLRDQVKALESLSLAGDVDLDVQPEVFRIDPARGLERLAEVLGLSSTPRIIEGVDIANLQGAESVGSLVCFIDGKPFKSGYRRFKIREVEGQDDYAMIREVIQRRYREAAKGEELYPDLILIDGGLGQLHAALDAFGEMDVKPPMVISLAKREEEVYTRAASGPLRLPRNDEALRLLQSVRDEAHRFAQHYHHILRRKRTLGEGDRPAGRRRRRRTPR